MIEYPVRKLIINNFIVVISRNRAGLHAVGEDGSPRDKFEAQKFAELAELILHQFVAGVDIAASGYERWISDEVDAIRNVKDLRDEADRKATEAERERRR